VRRHTPGPDRLMRPLARELRFALHGGGDPERLLLARVVAGSWDTLALDGH
jgi:hypothetical protein